SFELFSVFNCSTFLYLKFLVVWALVLLADFVLEFRFEYLWPFWLFIRSVYDSFRYQGLAFSVFFVCVAFTSDIICLLFIPVQWLFFAASTYVWVQYVWHTAAAAKGISEVDSTLISQQNGGIPASKKLVTTLPELEYREKGKDKDKEAKKQNLGINNNILQSVDSKVQEIEYMENHINNKRLNNDLVGSTENLLKEELCMASSKNYKNASGTGNSSPRSHSASNGSIPSSSSNKNEKKQKITSKSPSTHKDLMENCIPNNQLSKPDTLVRLHNAVQAKQKDKQTISQLEKRLKMEQEARAIAEKQLAEEKKRKKLEEATAARAVALAAATRGECTESLRSRIRELETECKKLTIDVKVKEEQIRDLEMKVQELRKYKESEKDTEVLMSALSAMQDKTQHLENSLSAETRIKLDLFSALGDAKRQLEIAQGQIIQKDQEIKDLKQKIAEVMAVMPSITYSADTNNLNPVAPHYSSKFMDTSPSGLDPNASVYQPLKK
ncbi:UNVERIFIED_CONTAM: hypothetical protein FKN15_071063, partial [Acipenser sinensis]